MKENEQYKTSTSHSACVITPGQKSTAPYDVYLLQFWKLTARDFQQCLNDVNSAEFHCIVESGKTILIQSIDLDLDLGAKLQKVIQPVPSTITSNLKINSQLRLISIVAIGPVTGRPFPWLLVRQLVTCKTQITSANQIHVFTCVLCCHLSIEGIRLLNCIHIQG